MSIFLFSSCDHKGGTVTKRLRVLFILCFLCWFMVILSWTSFTLNEPSCVRVLSMNYHHSFNLLSSLLSWANLDPIVF